MSREHIPAKVRREVKARFNGRCGYCGQESSKLQIDHVKPVIAGGTDDPSNLMPACASCNNYKLSLSLEMFRDYIQGSVRKARERSVNFRFAERYGLITVNNDSVRFYFEKTNDSCQHSNFDVVWSCGMMVGPRCYDCGEFLDEGQS